MTAPALLDGTTLRMAGPLRRRRETVQTAAGRVLCDVLDTSRWRRSFEILVDGRGVLSCQCRGVWPRWFLQGELGPATITQQYRLSTGFDVRGGPFGGATIEGHWLGHQFDIWHGARRVAAARRKLLTLNNTFTIEVARDARDDLLLTVLAMTIVLLTEQDAAVPGSA